MVVLALFTVPSALKEEHSKLSEIIATAALLVTYVVAALGYSTIYQATVRLGLWRSVVESLDVAGSEALERVHAAGEAELADRRRPGRRAQRGRNVIDPGPCTS